MLYLSADALRLITNFNHAYAFNSYISAYRYLSLLTVLSYNLKNAFNASALEKSRRVALNFIL